MDGLTDKGVLACAAFLYGAPAIERRHTRAHKKMMETIKKPALRAGFLLRAAAYKDRGGQLCLLSYAHHISPLDSKVMTCCRKVIAFSRPSMGVMRESSCSMDMTSS